MYMDKKQKAQQMKDEHFTVAKIAQRLQVDMRTVYRWFQKDKEDISTDIKEIPKEWILKGDYCIVGDVHVDAADWEFIAQVFKQAKEIKLKNLIIAGDLFSFHRIGKYPIVFRLPTMREELDTAKKFISLAMRYFDNVYWFIGNHDERFIARLEGDLDIEDMGDLICANGNRSRLFTSPHNKCKVISGGIWWHVSHAYEYSCNQLAIAKKFAQFHEMNVIHQHKHLVAGGLTANNKYVVIDNGCLCNQDQTGYAALRDSVMSHFQKSAVFLKDGKASLFTSDGRVFSYGISN